MQFSSYIWPVGHYPEYEHGEAYDRESVERVRHRIRTRTLRQRNEARQDDIRRRQEEQDARDYARRSADALARAQQAEAVLDTHRETTGERLQRLAALIFPSPRSV
jgi:predicted deacylase